MNAILKIRYDVRSPPMFVRLLRNFAGGCEVAEVLSGGFVDLLHRSYPCLDSRQRLRLFWSGRLSI